MEELERLRREIDAVDHELVALFRRRMEISSQIGQFKRARGLAVCAPAREVEKLREVMDEAGEALAPYAAELYRKLFELSRALQEAQE